MNPHCANQLAPGGSEREQSLPIPKACALRRRDIEVLTGPYAHGQVSRGGQDLFNQVMGLEPIDAPALVVLAWELKELLGQLVCVVDPGSPHPWLLRIELAPEYIWLGLHWAGPTAAVPWQLFFTGMVDIVNCRPLAAEIMFTHSLVTEWPLLLNHLENHFGALKGAAMYWWPPCTIPWSMTIDMIDPGPELDMPDFDNGNAAGISLGGGGGWPPLGAFQYGTAPALAPVDAPMDIDGGGDGDDSLSLDTLTLSPASAPASMDIPNSPAPALAPSSAARPTIHIVEDSSAAEDEPAQPSPVSSDASLDNRAADHWFGNFVATFNARQAIEGRDRNGDNNEQAAREEEESLEDYIDPVEGGVDRGFGPDEEEGEEEEEEVVFLEENEDEGDEVVGEAREEGVPGKSSQAGSYEYEEEEESSSSEEEEPPPPPPVIDVRDLLVELARTMGAEV